MLDIRPGCHSRSLPLAQPGAAVKPAAAAARHFHRGFSRRKLPCSCLPRRAAPCSSSMGLYRVYIRSMGLYTPITYMPLYPYPTLYILYTIYPTSYNAARGI